MMPFLTHFLKCQHSLCFPDPSKARAAAEGPELPATPAARARDIPPGEAHHRAGGQHLGGRVICSQRR